MRKIAFVLALIALALLVETQAKASVSVPKLDQVSSSIAGHSTQVACTLSWQEWGGYVTTTFGAQDPSNYEGFTTPGFDSTIYINPRVCESLLAAIRYGYQAVGPYYLAEAITVLIHESIHQRGQMDEGATDCEAVSRVNAVATSSFGAPAKVRVKVGRVFKLVTNPYLAVLHNYALVWHDARGPGYAGAC